MTELTPIRVIDQDELWQRRQSGVYVPLNSAGGLRVIDCGDDRELTFPAEIQRSQRYGNLIAPGRYFGAAAGAALTKLAVIGAQSGEKEVASLLKGSDKQTAFAEFTADVAAAYHEIDVDITIHSAETNEGNEAEFAGEQAAPVKELACAFAALLGRLLRDSHHKPAVSEAVRVASEAGIELPIKAAAEGARAVNKHLPTRLGLGRSAVLSAKRFDAYMSLVVLAGQHEQPDKTALTLDFAGFRSNARTSVRNKLPRYLHSPAVVADTLPEASEDYDLEVPLVVAAGVIFGTATRARLSGAETPHALGIEVIPPEYAV